MAGGQIPSWQRNDINGLVSMVVIFDIESYDTASGHESIISCLEHAMVDAHLLLLKNSDLERATLGILQPLIDNSTGFGIHTFWVLLWKGKGKTINCMLKH